MTEGAVPKHHPTIDEMTGAPGLVSKKEKVKAEDQVMEMFDDTDPWEPPKLGLEVSRAIRNVREAINSISLLHNVDIRELMDEHELTHGYSSLDSLDLLFCDPRYNVQSGRENIKSH